MRQCLQLLELRQVIARMLGLVIGNESMSAADFELVTRLEKLILANITSTLPVDNAFCDFTQNSKSNKGHITTTLQVCDSENVPARSSRSNRGHVTSTLPVDNVFSDLAANFRSRLADSPSGQRQPHDDDDDDEVYDDFPDSSRSNESHTARSRSRSLSPMRTHDPNIY